jgi:rhomboid protease GluP
MTSSDGQGPIRGNPQFDPEILPPDHPSYAPPRPVRRRRPTWSVAPATYLLLGINCAVFLAMTLRGVRLMSPSPDQLLNWGANNAGYVLFLGQWWRIVTAMFVHVGIIHLATNMWCLWNLGLLAEPLMGWFGVITVYLLTGASGNLLSTFYNLMWPIREGGVATYPVGAGASGAVFGIAGALIILLKSNRLPVPPIEVKRLRRSVIYFAIINLVIGGGITLGTNYIGSGIQVDNMAHLGGVACGLLFATPMVPRLGAPRTLFERRLRIAVTIVVTLLVLFGFFLSRLAGPVH